MAQGGSQAPFAQDGRTRRYGEHARHLCDYVDCRHAQQDVQDQDAAASAWDNDGSPTPVDPFSFDDENSDLADQKRGIQRRRAR